MPVIIFPESDIATLYSVVIFKFWNYIGDQLINCRDNRQLANPVHHIYYTYTVDLTANSQ